MKSISKRRNSEVDFWRLIFAFVVVIHHSHGLRPPDPQKYPFVGGYLAVEFFLILTVFCCPKIHSLKSGKYNQTECSFVDCEKILRYNPICLFCGNLTLFSLCPDQKIDTL